MGLAMPEELEKSTAHEPRYLSVEEMEELINLDVVALQRANRWDTASTFNRPVTEVHKEQFKLTRSDSIDVEIKSVFISEVSPTKLRLRHHLGGMWGNLLCSEL